MNIHKYPEKIVITFNFLTGIQQTCGSQLQILFQQLTNCKEHDTTNTLQKDLYFLNNDLIKSLCYIQCILVIFNPSHIMPFLLFFNLCLYFKPFLENTILEQGSWSSGYYHFSYIFCDIPRILFCVGIVGPATHYHLFSVFWPVVTFCNGLQELQNEIPLMGVRTTFIYRNKIKY